MYVMCAYYNIADTCTNPIALQGLFIPIISDEECSAIFGEDFNPAIQICVYGGEDAGIGACNVRQRP